MAKTTQANRSKNVTKQMKQKTLADYLSLTAACTRNRPSPAPRNRLKTRMLSDTTYLDGRPLLIYFLPQLPDFLTTNTFMSCRSWLTSSTLTPLIILYKTPSEAQVLKISVVFF